jgi:toxin YoeB
MRNLEFDKNAFEDLAWWIENDRKKALKIVKLIEETQKTPFTGTGSPEKLKYDLSGSYSRKIDKEHRLVYDVTHDRIIIQSCRTHYEN